MYHITIVAHPCHSPADNIVAITGALRLLGKVSALGTLEDNNVTDDEYEEEEGQFAKPGEVVGSDSEDEKEEEEEGRVDELSAMTGKLAI